MLFVKVVNMNVYVICFSFKNMKTKRSKTHLYPTAKIYPLRFLLIYLQRNTDGSANRSECLHLDLSSCLGDRIISSFGNSQYSCGIRVSDKGLVNISQRNSLWG
jgi:hypothetical protein